MKLKFLLAGLTFVVLTKFSYAQYVGQSSTQNNENISHMGKLGVGTTSPIFNLDVFQGSLGVHGTVSNVYFTSRICMAILGLCSKERVWR